MSYKSLIFGTHAWCLIGRRVVPLRFANVMLHMRLYHRVNIHMHVGSYMHGRAEIECGNGLRAPSPKGGSWASYSRRKGPSQRHGHSQV